MEHVDVMVLRTLAGWRAQGRRAMLVTVVRTWGSSPRPVGSVMALCEDGAVVGSVSGGCIEDDLIHRHAHAGAMPEGLPRLLTYGVSADEAHRFGLPCGGTLELLIEPDPDPGQLGALVQALDAGRLMRRSVRLRDGHVSLAETAGAEAHATPEEVVNTFGPAYRLLLIGAGALAECLTTMALFSGFNVTMCDPRPEYAGHWSVAGAKLERGMPDDVVADFRPDARSAVVALTHDPKLDDLALLEALQSAAFYVGAIGSRRNDAARRARLAEHFGLAPAQLQRLRGPVGLYIGSRTPPEIAVSIMAELLAVKNGIALPRSLSVREAKNQHAAQPSPPSCVPEALAAAA